MICKRMRGVWMLWGKFGGGDIMAEMLKYFDNTFFKFLFGFLGILFISLALLVVTQYWGNKNSEQNQIYTEVEINQVQ